MLNVSEDRESRRFTILEGISKDLSNSEIAAQLGVNRWIINSDIRRMKYARDPKLRQMYQKREKFINFNKQMSAQKRENRFYGMTGMTFNEKTFQNMIDFHRPELEKVMGSKDESHEISKLSRNARKILKRNKIINYGCKYYEITPKARNFLTSKQFHAGDNNFE
jgi:predicted DNA-binding protein YlxM (UPF0122 family)